VPVIPLLPLCLAWGQQLVTTLALAVGVVAAAPLLLLLLMLLLLLVAAAGGGCLRRSHSARVTEGTQQPGIVQPERVEAEQVTTSSCIDAGLSFYTRNALTIQLGLAQLAAAQSKRCYVTTRPPTLPLLQACCTSSGLSSTVTCAPFLTCTNHQHRHHQQQSSRKRTQLVTELHAQQNKRVLLGCCDRFAQRCTGIHN
jgi:hypothetical protein